MTSLTKKTHPPSKKLFFECRLEDLLHLEIFTGSVEHTRPEKFPRKATCVYTFFFKSPKAAGCQKVKRWTKWHESDFKCTAGTKWEQQSKEPNAFII